MGKESVALTVFFEDPFWVGVWERTRDGRLTVCKMTFGPEPKEYEVWEAVLKNYDTLRFGPPVLAGDRSACSNPGRLRKAARHEVQGSGVGTRSQQALKLLQEQGKQTRNALRREKREEARERKRELQMQKKKEKHRGH